MRSLVTGAFILVAACVLTTATAYAEPPPQAEPASSEPKHRLHWDPAWSHANAWDYTLAGIGATAVTVDLLVLQSHRPPQRWTEPILFDADVRNAMKLSSPDDRNTLEMISWGLWGAQMAYPVVVDVPFAWARYGSSAARDLFWQDAVTLTLAGVVDATLRDLGGRVRPHAYECLSQGGTSEQCLTSPESTRSFPGGHLTNSAAAAGLVCTQHLYTRLYGGPWDAVTCASTIAASATIATFRIMSDNHWATDQLVGAALGGAIGWAVPYVMHFHGHRAYAAAKDAKEKMPTAIVVPAPMMYSGGGGLGLGGVF